MTTNFAIALFVLGVGLLTRGLTFLTKPKPTQAPKSRSIVISIFLILGIVFMLAAGFMYFYHPASHTQESWVGIWSHSYRAAGGNIYKGRMSITYNDENSLKATYTNETSTGTYDGSFEGLLSADKSELAGRWMTSIGSSGRFRLVLSYDGNSFSGTYSIGDKPPASNPANTWNGVKINN